MEQIPSAVAQNTADPKALVEVNVAVRNVSFGGLIIASVDTEGRPALVRRLAKEAQRSIAAALPLVASRRATSGPKQRRNKPRCSVSVPSRRSNRRAPRRVS